VRVGGQVLGSEGKPIVGSVLQNPQGASSAVRILANVVVVERAMSQSVKFPDMRLEVIAAVRSLSDPQHQQARWGQVEEGVNYYDDLTLDVHTLYDDCMVLPLPQTAVPDVLHERRCPRSSTSRVPSGRCSRISATSPTRCSSAIRAGVPSWTRRGQHWSSWSDWTTVRLRESRRGETRKSGRGNMREVRAEAAHPVLQGSPLVMGLTTCGTSCTLRR